MVSFCFETGLLPDFTCWIVLFLGTSLLLSFLINHSSRHILLSCNSRPTTPTPPPGLWDKLRVWQGANRDGDRFGTVLLEDRAVRVVLWEARLTQPDQTPVPLLFRGTFCTFASLGLLGLPSSRQLKALGTCWGCVPADEPLSFRSFPFEAF